jgi:hypothetical protein
MRMTTTNRFLAPQLPRAAAARVALGALLREVFAADERAVHEHLRERGPHPTARKRLNRIRTAAPGHPLPTGYR